MKPRTQRGEAKRQDILRAAKHLFARKGFAATGVREIAAEAGVNPAMINYYFKSKRGLLEAILSLYFDAILPRAAAAFAKEMSARDTVREVASAFIDLFRNDLELLRVLVSQLPLDRVEDTAFPQDLLAQVIGMVSQNVLPKLEREVGHPIPFQIAMPALMGLVMGHFISRPALERITDVRFDDAFYRDFPDVVVGVLFDGFKGVGSLPRISATTVED